MIRQGSQEKSWKNLLLQLARSYGIEPQYQDGTGVQRSVPLSTLHKILSYMGVRSSSATEIEQSLAEVKVKPWRHILDDVVVVYPAQRNQSIVISIPLGSHALEDVRVKWTLQSQHSTIKKFHCRGDACRRVGTKMIQGVRHVRLALSVPKRLSLGYYRVTVRAMVGISMIEGTALMIAAPLQCYGPNRPRRFWGMSLQLYGLRSRRNWGIGDFGDLRRVMKWAGGTLRAETIGVNPLHAPTAGVISPYSPSSRLFCNPLYLDIESIEEFRHAPTLQNWHRSDSFLAELDKVREDRFINYEKISTLKGQMFEGLYRVFQQQHEPSSTSRARKFARFKKEGGEVLERFAVFQVLSENFKNSVWREWPKEFHDPRSPAVEAFKKEHQSRIGYYQYLQWQCEEQLRAVDRTGKKAKMPLGLYLDLPVGIHPDGADAWMFQQQLLEGVTIGAPPDDFNIQGQSWGLLAAHPLELRRNAYQLFIATLQRNMRPGGVLRIDHALGLFRLFLIPEGGSGNDGAYVQFPVNELLAILALESVTNRVWVVGEDLGTVTPTIKKRLANAGLLSYKLLPFERSSNGEFRAPQHYPEQALVSATTHDLPTLCGFWSGRDIEWREHLKMYASLEDAEVAWEDRAKDRRALLKAMRHEGVLPLSWDNKHMPVNMSIQLRQAVYAFLARARSRLLVIPLEDLVGEVETPNFPGVPHGAYPSWRVKLTPNIERLRTDPQMYQFSRIIKRSRSACARSH